MRAESNISSPSLDSVSRITRGGQEDEEGRDREREEGSAHLTVSDLPRCWRTSRPVDLHRPRTRVASVSPRVPTRSSSFSFALCPLGPSLARGSLGSICGVPGSARGEIRHGSFGLEAESRVPPVRPLGSSQQGRTSVVQGSDSEGARVSRVQLLRGPRVEPKLSYCSNSTTSSPPSAAKVTSRMSETLRGCTAG